MKATVFAIILVASCASAERAAAQNAYKCEGGYSQQPCPGGQPVAAGDGRTEAQKKHTLSAARRDARLADKLEKERLKQEAQPAQSYVPPPKFEEPAPAKRSSSTLRKPETFTAVVPGEKDAKKKKPAKTSGTDKR